jgi:hypothetical protein
MAGETGMARVDIAYFSGSSFIFYNVDAAVGKGCPNNPLDVLLVQYLLKECNKLPSFAKVETDAGFTQETMSVTGAWDQYWDGYLANFELTLVNLGRPALRDRRIDPVIGGRILGSIHHQPYMILWLNRVYRQVSPGEYSRIAYAADCPWALRQVLKIQFVGDI